MILLISVSVFLTLSAIVLLVYQLATAQQRQVAARLEQMARGEQAVVAKTSAYQEEEPTGIRRLLRSFGRYLESPRWDLSLEMRMLRAGLPLRSGSLLFCALLRRRFWPCCSCCWAGVSWSLE